MNSILNVPKAASELVIGSSVLSGAHTYVLGERVVKSALSMAKGVLGGIVEYDALFEPGSDQDGSYQSRPQSALTNDQLREQLTMGPMPHKSLDPQLVLMVENQPDQPYPGPVGIKMIGGDQRLHDRLLMPAID